MDCTFGWIVWGYEILADVLKRAQTLDKETVRKAFAATNLSTIQGRSNSMRRIFPLCFWGLQWIKGKKFPFDPVLVSNGNYKMLPKEAKMVSIHELRGIK